MKLVLLLLSEVCFTIHSADAENIPNYPTPTGGYGTTVLTDLPAPVADLPRQMVPRIAPAGTTFNGSDALLPGQARLDRRFIRAFSKGNRWVVAYEAAGRGYNDPILMFDLADNTATLTARAASFPEKVCADMTRLLDSASLQP
jgi:hypothetical protein